MTYAILQEKLNKLNMKTITTRSLLLFSNKSEIEIVTDEIITEDLGLHNLSNEIWLKRFAYDKGVFIYVNEIKEINGFGNNEIFVVYDGEYYEKDSNKLTLDGSRLEIFKIINERSANVHLAFHSKPTKEKQGIIGKCFPGHTKETSKHESSLDGKIFSQVFNLLYKFKNNNHNIFRGYLSQAANVDEIINIIFNNVGLNEQENLYVKYLLCCMSAETIKSNPEIIDNYSIFPEAIRPKIKIQIDIMKKHDFKIPDYQNAFNHICLLLKK